MSRLPKSFYLREDVVEVSKDLLGKLLVTRINRSLCSGIITETEAYAGITDKASHAYGGRRTQRNEIMYARGGNAYIYLCYGIHHLFNVVTNAEGIPHAVLIRAIFPYHNQKLIFERRKSTVMRKNLTVGPGKVSEALGLHTSQSGTSLSGNKIWLEDIGIKFSSDIIEIGPRIGVDYAGEDALRPYRFCVNHESLNSL